MEGMVNAALGNSEEMQAEAAVVSQDRAPAGSCPVPRWSSGNIALLQWKAPEDMALGRGPETKNWAPQ